MPGLAGAAPGDVTVVRSFAAPNVSPDGITTDGLWLYISECQSDTLSIVSPIDGSVAGTRKIPGFMIDHVSWDAAGLWLNDHDGRSVIAQVDPADGSILRQFDMPFANVMGVAWDGGRLWTMDATNGKVFTVDPATGQATYRFPTPAGNACGIAWDGQCLWVGDLTTKRFYLLDPSDGSVQADFRIPGPPTALPTGILWDGNHVWVMDEYPKAPVVYELQVEFPPDGPCARAPATGADGDAPPDAAVCSEPAPGADIKEVSAGDAAAADAPVHGNDPAPPGQHLGRRRTGRFDRRLTTVRIMFGRNPGSSGRGPLRLCPGAGRADAGHPNPLSGTKDAVMNPCSNPRGGHGMVQMVRNAGLAFLVLGSMSGPILGCSQGGDPANPLDVDGAFGDTRDAPGLLDIVGDPGTGDPGATDAIAGTDDVPGDDPSDGGPALVGSPCAGAESCPAGGSGATDCRLDWPGGYCAVAGCADHGHDCPGDAVQSKCVLAPTSMCLALCGAVTDCRRGYSCVAKPDAAGHGTANVCFPE